MTKEELLKDTIEYYSVDPKARRCRNEDGGCYYSPKKANKEGISEGCAIGRHLSPEVQEKWDGLGTISNVRRMLNGEALKDMPEWMREMDPYFLSQIQYLHDLDGNWDENGLTERGKMGVDEMIRSYSFSLPLYYKPEEISQ